MGLTGLKFDTPVKLWQLFTVTFKVKLVASIAMKDQMRFAIREGGKIGGAGVVAKTTA